MKKLLHSRRGASKGAALIVVFAFFVLATNLCLADPRSPTPAPTATPAATPTPGCYSIASVQIVTAGNFYAVGDNLDPYLGTLCGAADNYGFRLSVASVDPTDGHVTAVNMIAGIGYSNPPSNPVRFGGSATGTGFTANCTFSQ